MPDSLIRLLTVLLMGLLYLFFARVLYTVWLEVRPPRPARVPRARRERVERTGPVPTGLVVVAPEEVAGRRHQLADELTIGRAAGCEITVDDSYASQLHAKIFRRDSHLVVEDLGSTNGTYLNREKVKAPTMIHKGDRIQVGATVFEVIP